MEHKVITVALDSVRLRTRADVPATQHRPGNTRDGVRLVTSCLALSLASPITSGCDERNVVQEARPIERLADVTDTIPYQTNLTCAATVLKDEGPTPSAQIVRSLPGRLTLGLTVNDLPTMTDWAIEKSYKLDGVQWHYLHLKSEEGQSHTTAGAQVIDLDGNGTLDWIRISTVRSGGAFDPLTRSRHLHGGRTTTSNRSHPRHCYYDVRHTFTSDNKPFTDVAFGEAAYCAARIGCRISDEPLCSHPRSTPTLVIDELGSAVWMTLQGHGSFRPAHPTKFLPSPKNPVCHSWNSQRPYL